MKHERNGVELTPQELQKFRIGRACIAATDPKTSCFEREVSDQIRRSAPPEVRSTFGTGILIPTQAMRTALSADGAGSGSELVFTEPGPFVDVLRARSHVLKLGATALPGLRGPLGLPRQSGA